MRTRLATARSAAADVHAAIRLTVAAAACLLTGGCAMLEGKRDVAATETSSAPVATVARYRVVVRAPDELRVLLEQHLDLSRFQNAPAEEALTADELERLRLAAPAQARAMLETEGYFHADVRVARTGTSDLPLLEVTVEPGPRAVVGSLRMDVIGDLQSAAAAGDGAAATASLEMRRQWQLTSGTPFRLKLWSDSKAAMLNKARAYGYAAARWERTEARVDTATNRVDIAIVLDSGSRYKLGAVHVEGLKRYDEPSVLRLAGFAPGDPYSEDVLRDYQDRLQKVGLFEGAAVEFDADKAVDGTGDVQVRVQEHQLQQLTLGVGYGTNTGAQASAEHIHRRAFGGRWMLKNKVQVGTDLNSWEGDLTSHPLDGMARNLFSGAVSRLRVDDQVQRSESARAGRSHDTGRFERTDFVEATQATVDGANLSSSAKAVSLNRHVVVRNVDSVLLPTDGMTASVQGALGYGRGWRSAIADPALEERGPFARLYARLTWYQPFGSAWYGSARVEAGQVFTHQVAGVPDTMLFRAGGDDSVRGYSYRSLGPKVNGEVTSGRSMLTGSLEVARPILPARPSIWWAAFVDAGNAADSFQDIKPVWGYGVGVRWRSPVGPLRFDVAYGHQDRQFRFHTSVGIAF